MNPNREWNLLTPALSSTSLVEEREMEWHAWVRVIKARNSSGNSLPAKRFEVFIVEVLR